LLCTGIKLCQGQETVERTNKPNDAIKEKFTVLKSDKNVKQGLFQAFFHDTLMVASGRYDNGKKVGIWRYYSSNGSIDQRYDHTNQKLIYVTRPDTAFLQFNLDVKVEATDTLTAPVKVGGNSYGYMYIFYGRIDEFAKDIHDIKTPATYHCLQILSVGADGILKEWQMLATADGLKKLYNVSIDKLADDDKLFVPATLNGKSVASKVYIKGMTTTTFGSRGF